MNLDQRLLDQLRRVRVQLTAAISLGLLAGVLLIGQAYLLSQTVSRALLDGQRLQDVRSLLAGLAVIAVTRAAALWASEIASHHIAGRIKADLRERLFAHLIELGPAYARGERSGELANTATEGIEALDAYFSQYIPQLALSALIPLMMLIIVFPLDALSGVVLLLTAPMIPFFMVLIGSLASAQSRRQWTQLSRLSAHFLDVLQGLTTLKIFGRSREQAQEIARISEQFRDATMHVLRIAFLSALALEMLATISTAIIAVEIGLRLLYGRMAFDEAFFILILAPEYYMPLRALGARFHAGTAGTASAQRIFEVLSYQPSAVSGQLSDQGVASRIPTIQFETVSYTYADNEHAALDGVSFAILPRQKVALVGRSGAGKSTVAQLLLRFIEPTAGQIAVDGRDLSTIPPDDWRERIAWVPQMPYLFAASVADNILLARPDAPLADVIRAAQQAHADEFIRALPDGYDTPIGERGARLSGGQAQRIALARALLKDAPFLILDEATSNLDPETEADIQVAIHALMQDRTVLIIAHRLRTVMDADQIVVLDSGRAVEIGTPQDLSARAGIYRQLVTAHEP
jgi:ATP-binding cassette subfamily C protein CydD